uniref:site-specific DNA-methyltransferase (adenine-specific) n=1 Tax=Candidatus Kentrum sp. LFY TaxID=2126342 RepID=A0A450WXF2_9GAMM|nr:MAG: Methyltransferase domain-containing protein [Candidatus Kentron sp. LFY]
MSRQRPAISGADDQRPLWDVTPLRLDSSRPMTTAEKQASPAPRRIPTPKSVPPGMTFHSSLESVRGDRGISGYVTVIERAWKEMKLHGVLCLDGRPVLYHKEYDQPCSSSERIRQHKLFWNQGVANVLVLADPTTVYLYSGLVEPREDEGETKESALIERLGIAGYAERIQILETLFRQLATGKFYEDHRKYFDPNQSVDACLLKNLRDFRDKLTKGNKEEAGTKGLDIKEAHAFMGRILFLCYLLDRKIVDIGEPDGEDIGTTPLARELSGRVDDDARIDYLYGIFERLRERFNGNMFDRDPDAEKQRIRPYFRELLLFLGGHEVESGQMSLWPYDFKMIPVETISAIYQDFLAAEDKEGQRNTGAFYTPRFLAEIVVDLCMGEGPEAWNWSFLDPACGSGIFLVLLFNRIASRRLVGIDDADYSAREKALRDILTYRIRGVDISETACHIACFSLYLAYLDFLIPLDTERHTEKNGTLPRLFHDPDNPEQPADIPVIRKGDFLALEEDTFKDEEFPDGKFHCVIGNPPWEGRGSKQIAQKFMQETPRFLEKGGAGCLLLPTKILHNKTDVFQADWLDRVTLEKVLQLADYRKQLFQAAKTPAFIARFMNAAPDPNRHRVEFIAPKFNRDGLRRGVITINPAARTWIPLADILSAAQSGTVSVAWKQHLWGTRRDRKFLDLLRFFPPLSELAGEEKDGKRWIKGQGFQPYYPEKARRNPRYPKPKPIPYNPDDRFIDANKDFKIILLQEECEPVVDHLAKINASKKYLRMSPSLKLFKPPLVLVKQGINDEFIKAAYCDFPVLFQHSLQSIAGPEEDTELLMFLAAYLRSGLARYFLFHTAANWGTERDKVHLDELIRVPFPLPGHDFIAPDAAKIIREIAGKVRRFGETLQNELPEAAPSQISLPLFGEDPGNSNKNRNTEKWQSARKEAANTLQQEIDPLIYRYFGLTEQEIILIEDTVSVFIPSATPGTWRASIPTLDPVGETRVAPYDKGGLCVYGDTLAGTLNSWVRDGSSRYRVRAEVGADKESGLAMASLHLVEGDPSKLCQEKSISAALAEALKSYRETVSREAGTLLYKRDIFFFQGDCIHIVRSNLLINWTRTMALNDAAQIYGEIVLGKREGNAG